MLYLVLVEALLGGVDERLGLVLGLDAVLALLVLPRKGLCIAHHLLHLLIAQAAAGLDGDVLLLVRRLRGTGHTAPRQAHDWAGREEGSA